jgi:hypothetical protein
MLPDHIEDFARECLVDNRVIVLALQAGEAVGL